MTAMWVLQEGREIRLNSKYEESGDLLPRSRMGSVDGKGSRGNIKARGILAKPTQQDSC